jgi:hypothetical protein
MESAYAGAVPVVVESSWQVKGLELVVTGAARLPFPFANVVCISLWRGAMQLQPPGTYTEAA